MAVLPVWAGCASAVLDDSDDETTDDDEVAVAADSPYASSYSFFKITADLRKCPAPTCGGWFVQRLNRSTTKCFDGVYRESCYTAWLDWSQARLSDANKATMLQACETGASAPGVIAIVRGAWRPMGDNERYSGVGTFDLSEAWVAEPGSQSDGVFVRIADNGIRCFTEPCPHLGEMRLNSTRTANIDELDFGTSKLDDRQVAALIDAASTPEGIFVAGHRYEMYESGQVGIGRTVTAGYRRLADPACDPTGNCR